MLNSNLPIIEIYPIDGLSAYPVINIGITPRAVLSVEYEVIK